MNVKRSSRNVPKVGVCAISTTADTPGWKERNVGMEQNHDHRLLGDIFFFGEKGEL